MYLVERDRHSLQKVSSPQMQSTFLLRQRGTVSVFLTLQWVLRSPPFSSFQKRITCVQWNVNTCMWLKWSGLKVIAANQCETIRHGIIGCLRPHYNYSHSSDRMKQIVVHLCIRITHPLHSVANNLACRSKHLVRHKEEDMVKSSNIP